MTEQPDLLQRTPAEIHAVVVAGLVRRHRRERWFRRLGLTAVVLGLSFVVLLFASIIANASGAFRETRILLDIKFDPALLGLPAKPTAADIGRADYMAVVRAALNQAFPEVRSRQDRRALYGLVSSGAPYELRDMLLRNPELNGGRQQVALLADDDVDVFVKHFQARPDRTGTRLGEQAQRWVDVLTGQDRVQRVFNTTFFTHGDSREPELAGIRGAVTGSLLTLAVTLLLSFPIGVAAAVYLEEFAPKNRWTDLIEVNINNLAAVPSIVFGLLGLAVFINFIGLPRSAPLVGALVLTLMTLPTIIIASRAAMKAVPPSIREAALGMGASRMQTVFHHVLPLAMPGMLTGTIIGMAQALGETAPLLMIGMVAFIVDIPGGIFDPATVLPVQIYLWADSPERAFVERTSAAIVVLLSFLMLMNLLAVWLRRRFERRW